MSSGPLVEDATPMDPIAAKEALVKLFSTMFTKNDLEEDIYMLYHISPTLQIPLDIVRNHNRVKAITSDEALIKEVISAPTTKGATLLPEEGEDFGCKIQIKLGQITLIIRDIPENTSEETVRNIFTSIEGCPVPQTVKLDINNWFVTFDTEEEAKNALVHANVTKFNDKPVKARLKSETLPRASAVKNSNARPNMEGMADAIGSNPGTSSSGAQGDGGGNRNRSPRMSAYMGGAGGNLNQGGPPGYGLPVPPMQNYYYQQGAQGNPYMNLSQGYPLVMTPQGQYGMPYQGGRVEGSGSMKGASRRGNNRGQQQQQQQQQQGVVMYPGGSVMFGPQMLLQPGQGQQPVVLPPGVIPTVPIMNNSNKQIPQMMHPQQGQLVNSQGGAGMMTPQQLQMFHQQQYNMQMKQQQGQMDGNDGGKKKAEKKQGENKGGKKNKNKNKSNAPNMFSQNDFPDTIGSGGNVNSSGAALSGWAAAAKGNNIPKEDDIASHHQLQQQIEQYAQDEQMRQQMLQKQLQLQQEQQQQQQQQQMLLQSQIPTMQPPGVMQMPSQSIGMQQPQQNIQVQAQVPSMPPSQQQSRQLDAQNQLRAILSKAPQHQQGQGIVPQFPNHDSSDDIISFGSFDDSISLASSATLPVQVFASQSHSQAPSVSAQSAPFPHNDPSATQMKSENRDDIVNKKSSNDGNNKDNKNKNNNGLSDTNSGDSPASTAPTVMWGTKKSFADIVGKR